MSGISGYVLDTSLNLVGGHNLSYIDQNNYFGLHSRFTVLQTSSHFLMRLLPGRMEVMVEHVCAAMSLTSTLGPCVF